MARAELGLDAPVTTYLPWLTLSQEGAAQQVTLRRLMSHTAGLVMGNAIPFQRAPAWGLLSF